MLRKRDGIAIPSDIIGALAIAISVSNLQRILKEEKEFPEMRNYEELYTNLHLKYRILAGESYLRDNSDVQVIRYTYLSGMAAICAYLFHKATPHQDYNDTDQKNMMYDFSYGLLQLFAVQNSLPKCLCSLEHPYVQLLLGYCYHFSPKMLLLPRM